MKRWLVLLLLILLLPAFGWAAGDPVLTGSVYVSLNKIDATAAPEATNDTSEGYSVGSAWVDVTGDTIYFCVDATEDAAVWEEVGAGSGSVTYASAAEINTGTETAKAINPDALADSKYGLDRTVQSVTASSGTGTPNVITLNLNSGHIILLTMDEDSEIAFSNVPSGYCRAIVRFIQDAGGDEPWTNQDDFLWPLGVEMDLSTAAGAKDDFQFYTFDGGTTWNVAMIGAEVQ